MILNKKQIIIRFIVIFVLLGVGFALLFIFINAVLFKISPPLRIFPQIYFALGYLFLGIGFYLIFVTLKSLISKK